MFVCVIVFLFLFALNFFIILYHIFPTKEEFMSQHQMSLYQNLILGLPIPAPVDYLSVCLVGNLLISMVTIGLTVSRQQGGQIELLMILEVCLSIRYLCI